MQSLIYNIKAECNNSAYIYYRTEEHYMNLKGRDFLKLLDYSAEEIEYLIDLAAELKRKKKEGILHDELRGKNIALVFEKTSMLF